MNDAFNNNLTILNTMLEWAHNVIYSSVDNKEELEKNSKEMLEFIKEKAAANKYKFSVLIRVSIILLHNSLNKMKPKTKLYYPG